MHQRGKMLAHSIGHNPTPKSDPVPNRTHMAENAQSGNPSPSHEFEVKKAF